MSDHVESSTKKITLTSSDGEIFEIEKEVAMESKTIKNLIEDLDDNTRIPIYKVRGEILALVIEYCKKHVNAMNSDEKPSKHALKMWDAEFVQLDQPVLFDLISAANFLDIKSLYDLTCKTVADMMNDKTPEQIREMFNIVNDYSPQEEEAIRSEHPWAYE
ncbi:putative S-phase kinase-associated protein [Medicago truncatula]|uniref:SKP1-like protein n=1 Tax=Medicago truncatula TaxID=3880 RepID=A0A072UI32_MEDTR|nr:SKP1-like protein 14 [Medicago truncatula]KEH29322.1 SCF ubiquitin ligase, SKP1 component [Medicago truncatula]RHN59605.1 putative S-phase kinase-associated protein [Medicago truncatula]